MINIEEIKRKLIFYRRIDENGCWIWMKGKSTGGYGSFYINHRPFPVHRLSALVFNLINDIYTNLLVCHHCDVPSCFNPEHLFIGTDYDNSIDCLKKKHRHMPYGENHYQAQLTNEQVKKIREDYRVINHHSNAEELSYTYNVSSNTIKSIGCGKTWKRVK